MGNPIGLSSKFVLVLTLGAILDPTFASSECKFPAIFNFGDSNSDTGAITAAFTPLNSPYGDTYFHMPSGRFSDGRLIIDFIAKSFHHPFLSAYLDSMGSNYSHGANFATAGSTIRIPTSIIPSGEFSPFSMDVQFLQFLQFMNRSQVIREKGGVFAELMPKQQDFAEALYTFDIGQNDLEEGFFGNMSIEQVNVSVTDIVTNFSKNVMNLYGLGARSFWIHNTGPIGCLSHMLTSFPSAQKDSAGCAQVYNQVAQYFNYLLNDTVAQLRNDLPLASITLVDLYSVKYSLFKDPTKYGFEFPLITCCGYGGSYNYSSGAGCGATITVNGTQTVVGSCDRPAVRVIWDGVHYTEAANKFIFSEISVGSFSDPPVPLAMACLRTTRKD